MYYIENRFLFFFHGIYILQQRTHKLIQVPHANFFTFLTTFGHSFCLHYQIQGNSKKLSHIFWRILDTFDSLFTFY